MINGIISSNLGSPLLLGDGGSEEQGRSGEGEGGRAQEVEHFFCN